VMRARVANGDQGVQPTGKHGLGLIELLRDFFRRLALRFAYILDTAPKLKSSVAI
jgi:hypothetical protein